MGRIKEYFKDDIKLKHKDSVCLNVRKLYRQERDWTCSIACVRTILSAFLTKVEKEKYYIDTFKLKPGPNYSKDIKRGGWLRGLDTIYACDYNVKEINFDVILKFMNEGYGVMLESMYSYSHWMVLLSYYNIDNDIEKSKLVLYDPYYDEIKVVHVDEFICMWLDGDYKKTNVYKDFIAIRV